MDNKKVFTVRLDNVLIERMRNIVYWTPGLTLVGLVEKSLTDTVNTLEDARGGFPVRVQELKTGKKV